MNKPSEQIILQNKWELAEYISRLIGHAEAYEYTSLRLDDAHEYCKKYIVMESWGKNVWHAILDDAIRMREECGNSK